MTSIINQAKSCCIYLLVLAWLPCAHSVPVTEGLIGYWSFDYGPEDQSIYNRGGTISGGVFWEDSMPDFGKCYRFDGSGIISANEPAGTAGSSSISFSFWIKPNSTSDKMCIFRRRGHYADHMVSIENSKYHVEICYINGRTGSVEDSNCSYLPGIWQHVAVVFNASSHLLAIYRNGSLDTTFPAPDGIEWSNFIQFCIGNRHDDLTRINFIGSIDEFAIYSRPLTASEILTLANEPIIPYHCPSTPSKPIGPSLGLTNQSLSFVTGGSTCNQGHTAIQYRFVWGDGQTSIWSSSASASHSWSNAGIYSVRSQTWCTEDGAFASPLSASTIVTIKVHSVAAPIKPTGPALVPPNTSFTFSSANSTCTASHAVQYRFDWGDRQTSVWSSSSSASHSWMITNRYAIRCQARCATDNLILSSWSVSSNITVAYRTSITTNLNWVNDGSIHRHQYGNSETVHMPFRIACNGNIDATACVQVAPADNHSDIKFSQNFPVSLMNGSVDVEFLWPVDTSLTPAGFYDVLALISNLSYGVMDTTFPGTNNIQTSGAWITGAETNIEIVGGVMIRPATNYINDGRIDIFQPGYKRNQYFRDQKVCFPLEIICDDAVNNANIYVSMAKTNSHSEPSFYIGITGRELVKGTNLITDIEWTCPGNAEYGYYDTRAHVSALGVILDTTERGYNNTNLETNAAWLVADTQKVQICRGSPVILVHGYGDNARECWGYMENLLEEINDFAVLNFDYGSMTDDDDDETPIECLAAALRGIQGPIQRSNGEDINNSLLWTNSIGWAKSYFNKDKVDIIAHSMGGLLTLAYMSGMASNGTQPIAYNNDIDHIVTLGTPMCGGLHYEIWVNSIWPWGHKPLLQGCQLDWGSQFFWNLHSRARQNGRHLAIAGSVFGGICANDNDGVVSVGSAACPSLVGATRILHGYGHIPMFANPHALALLASSDAVTHDGYRLIVEMLSDYALSFGDDYVPGNRSRSFLMFDVMDKDGTRVPCWFRVIKIENQEFVKVLQHSWHKTDNIHAYVEEINGTYRLEVTPTGPFAYRYRRAYADFSVNGNVPTLLPITLQNASDDDSDYLPDDWETDLLGGTWYGPNDDPDQDGFNNYWELVLGTNPNDSKSRFEITGFSIGSSRSSSPTQGIQKIHPLSLEGEIPAKMIFLTFNAIPGVTYQLLRTTDLSSGVWETVSSIGPDASGTVKLEDPSPPESKGFYQINLIIPH